MYGTDGALSQRPSERGGARPNESAPGAGLPGVTGLRVHAFSISLDGYGAGPGQGTDTPLGAGGERLHEWIFGERSPVDERFVAAGTERIGATVME